MAMIPRLGGGPTEMLQLNPTLNTWETRVWGGQATSQQPYISGRKDFQVSIRLTLSINQRHAFATTLQVKKVYY